jgi:anti-sigma regulatory factor (Ser/Thr protein kinase)
VTDVLSTTNDVHGAPSFRHEALFYANEEEFLAAAVPFVREGMAGGEAVLVIISASRIGALRAGLTDTSGVAFADMAEVGANPARIIPAWREFLATQPDGQLVRGIGEPVWPGRSPAELVECQRHESLLNVAFAHSSAWRLLCPYDTTALDDLLIDEARRSHPVITERGASHASLSCRGLAEISAPFAVPLTDPPPGAPVFAFGRDDLRAVREFVSTHATQAGLGSVEVEDLVLAAHEMTINSVVHGGGRGQVRTWAEGDTVLCEVRDAGRIQHPLVGREAPQPDQLGGRGLWLANQLCDLVQVRTFGSGNVVRLHMRRRR